MEGPRKPRKKRTYTEEQREWLRNHMRKMREMKSNTQGIPRTPEVRKKISDATKGKKKSDTTKMKVAAKIRANNTELMDKMQATRRANCVERWIAAGGDENGPPTPPRKSREPVRPPGVTGNLCMCGCGNYTHMATSQWLRGHNQLTVWEKRRLQKTDRDNQIYQKLHKEE